MIIAAEMLAKYMAAEADVLLDKSGNDRRCMLC